MNRAPVLACMAMVVTVIWYGSGIHHLVLPPLAQPAATTAADTPTHHHVLAGGPRGDTQGHAPTAPPPKHGPAHDSANTTLQVRPSPTCLPV